MLLGIPTELVSELCNFSSASVALRESSVSRIGNLVGAHVAPFFRVLTKPVKQMRSKQENDICQRSKEVSQW